MRPLSLVPLLVLLTVPPAAAQTSDQPNLVLTLFGGAVTGHSLWHIGHQPLCVLLGRAADSPCSTEYDTLDLARDISSSIVAGASATYFKGPHLGFQGEIYYLGFTLDDTCKGVFYNPDAESRNQQLCNDISALSLSTSAIAIIGSVVLRASAAHAISPYVSAGVGVVSHSGGTIEMSGRFISQDTLYSRAVLVDDHPSRTSVGLQLAAGMTTRLSPGYQFRLELRDAVVPLQRVTGPANNLAQAPTASKTYHHIALTLGLDIVLEKKRGRRY